MMRPRALVDSTELARLSSIRQTRALLAIGRQWAVITAVAVAALGLSTWWAYALAVVVIATRQHGLAVLMHDGAHGHLLRNRQVNDLVSDLLLAFPLGISTTLYRNHHFQHHAHLGSDRDPDRDNEAENRSMRGWLLLFAGDLCGLNVAKVASSASQFSLLSLIGSPEKRHRVPPWQLAGFAAYLVAVGAVLTLTSMWIPFLLLWMLPMLTVLSFILRIRAIAEHVGCPTGDTIAGSRTVLPGAIERALFAPCGVNYHLAHHLFPGVPFYNLKYVQQILERDSEFRVRARRTSGYICARASVMREIAVGRS